MCSFLEFGTDKNKNIKILYFSLPLYLHYTYTSNDEVHQYLITFLTCAWILWIKQKTYQGEPRGCQRTEGFETYKTRCEM